MKQKNNSHPIPLKLKLSSLGRGLLVFLLFCNIPSYGWPEGSRASLTETTERVYGWGRMEPRRPSYVMPSVSALE